MILSSVILLASAATAAPDCSQWYKTMAWVSLKNESLIDPSKVLDSSGQAKLLASESLGKDQLRKYVYVVTFPAKAGGTIQAIATGKSSASECSQTGVDVYIVAKAIDGGP